MSHTPTPSDRRSVAASVALYRVLLLAYPATFRRLYGPQMVQAFRDTCRQASAVRGLAGVFALWLPTLADLVMTAGAERLLVIRRLSRTQVIRLCGLLTLIGAALSVPLLLGHWWMFTVLTSPAFMGPRCHQGCTLSYADVSSLGTQALLTLRLLVALCLPFGLLGVLALQQGRWARRLSTLALLGQVGVAGSSAMGGDSYILSLLMSLRRLLLTVGVPVGPLAFPVRGIILLAWFIAPVALFLCGALALRTRRWEAWRVALLLLGSVLALQSFWLVSVEAMFNLNQDASLVFLIDTGLALVGSALWASLGYALWVRKDEPTGVESWQVG